MLEGPNFIIIAGVDLVKKVQAEKKAAVRQTGAGYASEDLCAFQRRQAGAGLLGVEVVMSNYGCSVRYDSGLQNWGLLASARRKDIDGTVEAAEAWVRKWVAEDPAHRYGWRRA